MTGHHEPLEN